MSKSKKSVETVPMETVSVETVPMETVPAESPAPIEDPTPTVAFNVWFAMREKKIPARHLREILWADFKGQGLSSNETIADFDSALVKYGVKLR